MSFRDDQRGGEEFPVQYPENHSYIRRNTSAAIIVEISPGETK
jgi:hypothetical protein